MAGSKFLEVGPDEDVELELEGPDLGPDGPNRSLVRLTFSVADAVVTTKSVGMVVAERENKKFNIHR